MLSSQRNHLDRPGPDIVAGVDIDKIDYADAVRNIIVQGTLAVAFPGITAFIYFASRASLRAIKCIDMFIEKR